MWHWLPLLGPLYEDVPINEGNYKEPAWFTPIMQFNDRFGSIVWPVAGVAVLGIIVWAVLKSASHKSIPGPERMAAKKEILHELRRQLQGMSLAQLAELVRHPQQPTHELVEEMVKDGMLRADVNSKGARVYKLPGL